MPGPAVKGELGKRLTKFAADYKINSKGPLCLVLVVTRSASKQIAPYIPDQFLTPQGGQVAGLGRAAVQAILLEHGINRVLAEEGGRTSRGGIKRMRGYLDLLNILHGEGLLDFAAIEQWWIERVKAYFASKPFKLRIDPSKSLRSIVDELIEAAFARQRECPGTMVAGAVMQHLVGAKLEIALPGINIKHHGFAVADAQAGRKGDFLIGDTAIHVTTAPTEALIRKCCDNLSENLRPIIITTQSGAGGAGALAKNADVGERIDILEVQQFVATNVYEWSRFEQTQRPVSIRELVKKYNRIIEKVETDPSLRISMG
ncbi:MAG: DUF4928 family protein [Proteobacteria bacterium]|nr:DUF4928 family protein [Pseudomonadota bacterium]